MKTRYVLWVRHCESCSNVAFKGQFDIMSKFRQPLCTMKGVRQAHTFGVELQKYSYKIVDEYNLDGVNFYSSYLPRAFETAKLISAGYIKRKTKRNINRIPFISEHVRFYDKKSGSQSMTPIYKSNCYVNALNQIIPIGLDINPNNLFEPIMKHTICKNSYEKDSNIDKCVIKSNKNDYNNFIDIILHKLPPNRLNIIVSHGGYIKSNVLKTMKCHHNDLHNLEAHLICYTRIDDSFKPKYVPNRYITRCNKTVSEIKKGDLSGIGLIDEYNKYFNCKYHYHDKHPILRTSRKTTIEKYCK